jgi:hypothetical protein
VARRIGTPTDSEVTVVHRTDVERYLGTLRQLADDLGDLRYDALAEFLGLLAAKLAADAAQDEGRGRRRLSALLRETSHHLTEAAESLNRTWRLCEPYMADGPK